ncbi:hypothetical protein L804_01634 [Cryptococcus deuterogattii 2001/935-1]|nr:hypothetical protein L804_01634 [Cryptococcus deuterogattii 2001/935-1]
MGPAPPPDLLSNGSIPKPQSSSSETHKAIYSMRSLSASKVEIRGQSAIPISREQGRGQGTGLEENGILRQLDERTKRIEGLLRRETGARQPPVIRKDEGLRVERLQPVAGSVGAAVHLASALCVRSGWAWIDPVESGVLSGDAFEKAHARFLSTFYRILPLPHIIAVPTHPFVRLALITYLNPGVQPISSLLSSALTSLHMFEPSEDIVLALLIISHLPVSQYWTVIDPYGAGARAHQMATALGLPDSARWLKLLRHEIEEEWNKKLLNRAILWYAVQHRMSWIQIFTSPSMSWYPSSPPIHETVPFHFAQHLNSPAMSHIILDSLLMESLWPVIEALQAVRLNRQYEEQRVVALKDAWTVFEERAATWSTEVENAHPPELIRRLENHSPSMHWRGAFDDILLGKENEGDLENPYGMFMWDGMLDLSDWAEGIDLTTDWQLDPLRGIIIESDCLTWHLSIITGFIVAYEYFLFSRATETNDGSSGAS